ncbi:MAG: tRNA uracil 4-sulfurtransferase ThiI [Patescibacteria group bacterium]|nr:tRNA uracil 4-sulfurtransferase ThiI [Patescibacteria group bacterium]
MSDTIIVHTDEISLKGGNRSFFENLLMRNIRARIDPIDKFRVGKRKGIFICSHDGPMSEEQERQVTVALGGVFGVATFWLAEACPKDLAEIKKTAVKRMAGKTGTFRVTAKRGDKRFPQNSMEVSRQVGGVVLAENDGLKVDLHHPDHVLYVEINQDGAFVSVGKHCAAGGLPTDSTGKVVVMLSGGIDSPVAAWKVMSRGCRAVFVHFHSYPHVGKESIEKVRRLARALDRYQLGSVIYMVPFADIQREITAKTEGELRVVLYRRFMMRIAEAIARKEGALGIVTGDSIGQVASQTLENLATVTAAVSMPVHRPLIGDGKNDIVAVARKIDTYDISIEPHDDCCSLFVPDHPELRSTVGQAENEEGKLDVDALIRAALSKTEINEI